MSNFHGRRWGAAHGWSCCRLLIVCDGNSNGDVTLEGGDSILVQVDTGPYMGYTNHCDPLVVPEPPAEPCGVHGNITVKS
jgi:hypothetical protein